jgi:uncharacterized membrane protein YfcA
MSISLLIATSFSIGFFVESIVGFGGGLIAYAILGFFIGLKEMVIAGLYIGTCSSLYIIFTDYKSWDKKTFFNAFPLSLIGTVAGVFIFSRLSVEALYIGFGSVLLTLSIKLLFFDKIILPRIFRDNLVLIGGMAQGAFGTGGPFWASALSGSFKTKSNLRTTMASFFVFFNLVRVVQLWLEEEIKLDFFYNIWWTIIPVFVAIKLGHLIHVRISEKFFKNLIAAVTFLAGLKFLSKCL